MIKRRVLDDGTTKEQSTFNSLMHSLATSYQYDLDFHNANLPLTMYINKDTLNYSFFTAFVSNEITDCKLRCPHLSSTKE
jgi:hypothetical protein